MRIAIFEIEDWEREVLARLEDEHDVVFVAEPLDAENAGEFADREVISTFIGSKLDREVLEQFDDLRLVVTRSTGYDHVGLDCCREHGVVACNVPGYGEHTVAEHVFGLLLTISHDLWSAIDRTRRGDFSSDGLRGFDLRGRTLGVVGTGAIGRHVIRIARGFGMDVVAHDVAPREELTGELGFRYAPLEEVLATADVITLHVPLNDQTRHLIGPDEFARMKDDVVLINTSRGAVVDVRALMDALAHGTIAAAGLDVLPEEPAVREEAELLRTDFRSRHDLETLLADHILLRQRNVYITPHTAFNTREAIQRILETTVENIRDFARGEPANVVGGTGTAEDTASARESTPAEARS